MQAVSGIASPVASGNQAALSYPTHVTAFQRNPCLHLRPAAHSAPGVASAKQQEAHPRRRLGHRPSSKATRWTMNTRLCAQAQQVGGSTNSSGKKTGVLFVCLGNICRSPTAEAMFRAVVEREGLSGAFDIDSCGTGGGAHDWYKPGGYSYHEGDAADARMSAAAKKRGVFLTSRSRPLLPADLKRWDYIIGMDEANSVAILKASDYWVNNSRDKAMPDLDQVRAKTSLMTQYCTKYSGATHVPDPYYGGPAGFEKVLDLLDDACSGLLAHIQEEQQAGVPS